MSEGYLEGRQGSGVFVAPSLAARSLHAAATSRPAPRSSAWRVTPKPVPARPFQINATDPTLSAWTRDLYGQLLESPMADLAARLHRNAGTSDRCVPPSRDAARPECFGRSATSAMSQSLSTKLTSPCYPLPTTMQVDPIVAPCCWASLHFRSKQPKPRLDALPAPSRAVESWFRHE